MVNNLSSFLNQEEKVVECEREPPNSLRPSGPLELYRETKGT